MEGLSLGVGAMVRKIRVVCATRRARDEFFTATALGRSLSLCRRPAIELRLFERNALGLPHVYNAAIQESAANPALLLFVHDDIHLCDFYWPDSLIDALNVFELVGLAGNKRRVPRQPAWAFIDDRFTWDQPENLSGIVGHGTGFPPAILSVFGPSRQAVKLLDGLLLAVHSETLQARGLRFDERFNFHFYDMDFCREAERLGVRMGTWSISVIHESGGNFGSEGWRRGYASYLEKWGE